MNLFEAQLEFLRTIAEMVKDEDIYLEGEVCLGFELLKEEYETKAKIIHTRELTPEESAIATQTLRVVKKGDPT